MRYVRKKARNPTCERSVTTRSSKHQNVSITFALTNEQVNAHIAEWNNLEAWHGIVVKHDRLYAVKDYAPGEFITKFTGKCMKAKQAEDVITDENVTKFLFLPNERNRMYLDGRESFSYGVHIHKSSKRSHATCSCKIRRMFSGYLTFASFFAKRPIKAGSEITYSYD